MLVKEPSVRVRTETHLDLVDVRNLPVGGRIVHFPFLGKKRRRPFLPIRRQTACAAKTKKSKDCVEFQDLSLNRELATVKILIP
jgi:hypothetical protein